MLHFSSGSYTDELAWAAIWLYKATGEQNYLTEAKQHASSCCSWPGWAFSWDEKSEGVSVSIDQAIIGIMMYHG